jgi:hypothetical protein
VASLKIQLYWREQFVAMDPTKPDVDGGLVLILDAAATLRVTQSALASELYQDRALNRPGNRGGWLV